MSKLATISIEGLVRDRILEKQESVEQLFSDLFSILNIGYEDLNKKIYFDRETALKISKRVPKLIIGGNEGIYFISSYTLISTITKLLMNKQLTFTIDEKRKLIGGRFIPDGDSKHNKL